MKRFRIPEGCRDIILLCDRIFYKEIKLVRDSELQNKYYGWKVDETIVELKEELSERSEKNK